MATSLHSARITPAQARVRILPYTPRYARRIGQTSESRTFGRYAPSVLLSDTRRVLLGRVTRTCAHTSARVRAHIHARAREAAFQTHLTKIVANYFKAPVRLVGHV